MLEYGNQPLNDLMIALEISNADLVNVSTEQLTFKMVQKARKGRRVTPNVQCKILSALCALKPESNFTLTHLFNY